MPRKKLMIFPFNGNGVEALDCIDFDEYDFIGFIDDDISKMPGHYQIFSREILQEYKELCILAVPGSSLSFKNRIAVIDSLKIENSRYVTIIHKNAAVGRNVKVGYNSLIMANVVLTSNAEIQNHVCILPNSVIHHDVVVGNYTLIGSNVVIAGGTTIGQNCYIGSRTNIINGVRIGHTTLLGLGSNIIKDVPCNSKMVGNPAHNLNTNATV